MPYSKDYFQSTTPETISVGTRTYITLELINQARRSYAETRELINLNTARKRNHRYQRLAPTKSKYSLADAEYCATHTVEEICERFNVAKVRAYQLKHYLGTKFGVRMRTK